MDIDQPFENPKVNPFQCSEGIMLVILAFWAKVINLSVNYIPDRFSG